MTGPPCSSAMGPSRGWCRGVAAGGERFGSWSTAFVRPAPGTVTLGLGGGHLGKPEKGVLFTPIMELAIP
ncbi:hypothetical protein [Sinomonas gamaensis]|uniref:hypothetical protein n=1 Tax=Sinomonas gamaensis TaxID=2565624 RepID=UPI0011092CF9|nr:hypothetical protein [Sinomonas gamaensis]